MRNQIRKLIVNSEEYQLLQRKYTSELILKQTVEEFKNIKRAMEISRIDVVADLILKRNKAYRKVLRQNGVEVKFPDGSAEPEVYGNCEYLTGIVDQLKKHGLYIHDGEVVDSEKYSRIVDIEKVKIDPKKEGDAETIIGEIIDVKSAVYSCPTCQHRAKS